MKIESNALLADYAANGSEDAFRELAARYSGLVYSSALRLVRGDTHRAEDVAQTVFADLAKHARAISPAVMLGGWLHRRTFNVATTMMRSERRRKLREQELSKMKAVEDHSEANLARIAPILDEAIIELKGEDRAAILLRFFERRDLRSIGKAFGTSEDAAQKRVVRALDKMRLLLERRGVVLSASALGSALTAEALTAAPAILVTNIAATAVATAALGSGTWATWISALTTMYKLKWGLLALAFAAATGVIVLQQHQNANLRTEVNQLRAELLKAGPMARRQTADAGGTNAPRDNLSEVLRLRAMVTSLQRNLAEASATTNAVKGIKLVQDFNGLQHSLSPEDARLILTFDSLQDKGLHTPEAAVETYLWTRREAMSTNSLGQANKRVKEITWIPPGITFGGYAAKGDFDPFSGSDLAKLEAVTYPTADTAELYVAFYDRDQGVRRGQVFKLIRDGEFWKVDIGLH